jgi:ElaB/YqjD/DUF883 family membrane-anchored ribosome-binding protein
MDRESPEIIDRQMHETRQSLTDKVALLEGQVVGTLQDATSAVQDTVETVKAAVQDTVANVQDSMASVTDGVKETLNVKHHVEKAPWPMVGGSALLGFLTGLVVFPRRGVKAAPMASQAYGSPPAATTASSAFHRPGWVDDLLESLGKEAKKIGETAIASVSQSLKQSLEGSIPQWIDAAIPHAEEQNAPGAYEPNGLRPAYRR